MKKQKRNTLILMVLLLLITLTAAYVASTYAKYTAVITGKQGTATVATWAFDTENQSKTLAVELDGTYDATTLVADRIAPGTQGHFAIQLTNAQSETGVDFTLNVGTPTGAPTNLKFYKDANRTSELSASNAVTGKIAAGDSTGIAATIYWEWAYETGTVTDGIATGDSDDTANGKAQSKSVTVPVTIKGVQTQPGAAITTHIDPVTP